VYYAASHQWCDDDESHAARGYHRCERSRLEFFLPEEAAGSELLYTELQKFDWYYMREKWEFETAVKDLATCQRILEAGCGTGLFLEKASSALPGSVVKGVELSAEAVRSAREKGLNVERSDLKSLVERDEKFDAVCSFQVLEHLTRPRDFIKETIGLLNPGGLLIISVPNKDGFLRHSNALLEIPPHHMTRWGRHALRHLEKIFPVRLLKTKRKHKKLQKNWKKYHAQFLRKLVKMKKCLVQLLIKI